MWDDIDKLIQDYEEYVGQEYVDQYVNLIKKASHEDIRPRLITDEEIEALVDWEIQVDDLGNRR